MEKGKVPIDMWSLAALQASASFQGREISRATAFLYRQGSTLFVVTNWHVVTGRHSETEQLLNQKTAAIPSDLVIRILDKSLNAFVDRAIPLYRDEQQLEPNWLVHPKHGRRVDVAVLEVSLPANFRLFPVNEVVTRADMSVRVSDDAFVLGFPLGLAGAGHFPIWKRASIATEPDTEWLDLPALLIDTATRQGMSGAPVVVRSNSGTYLTVNGHMVIAPPNPPPTKFIGIYSARDNGDELRAQLGIVWKEKVIEEIVSAHRLGTVND